MSEINLSVIAYLLGALALAIYTFTAYNPTFIVNAIAMTVTLYDASSIVLGLELKKLLNVFVISFLATIISDFCFSFFHPFIALCISLLSLLVAIRYSMIGDHDSGWFGALCAELIGLIFLLVVEMTLAIAQLFLF